MQPIWKFRRHSLQFRCFVAVCLPVHLQIHSQIDQACSLAPVLCVWLAGYKNSA